VILAAATNATIFAAFTAGLLSFVSPCVLPLVPGYLSTVTGVRPGTPKAERDLPRILWPATIFCLSFTAVFVALGMFATGIGAPLADDRDLLNRLAGAFLVVFGVLLVLSPFVRALNREFRPSALIERAGAGAPLVAGAAFAVAWTPCTGPILGAILTAAAQRDGIAGGAFLLLAYSAGLAVPFLASAVAFDRFSTAFRWLRDHYQVITIVSGAVLIAVGILVFNSEMTRLASEARTALDAIGLDLSFFER